MEYVIKLKMEVIKWKTLVMAVFLIPFWHCEGKMEKDSSSPLSFTRHVYNATIYENSAPRTYVDACVQMGIYIMDPTWVIKYKIVSGDSDGLFKTEEYTVGDFCFLIIKTKTGNMAVLNREVKDHYVLTVQATEKNFHYNAWTKVVIQILDRNDLKPLFSPPSYSISVKEDAAIRSSIATVSATDADAGPNANFYYTFNTRTDLFFIHPSSGVVRLSGKLNHTRAKKHELEILAMDRMMKIAGGSGIGNVARLLVHVEPATRKPPVITSIKVMDSDTNRNPLYAVITVNSSSSDAGINSVNIVAGDPSEYFKIIRSYAESNEFMVLSNKEIHWMKGLNGFNLSIQAKDKSQPPLFSSVHIINIQPPKHALSKFEQKIYTVVLSEFTPPGSLVVMVKVTPSFPDLKYTLISDSHVRKFKINPRTGLITTSGLMNFQEKSYFKLKVIIGEELDTAVVHVNIKDDNNNAPKFSKSSYYSSVNENVPVGTTILEVTATDEDTNENGLVTYSIVNQELIPFMIDPFSGVITTSKELDYELMQRWYHLQIWASDLGTPFRRETEVPVTLVLNNVNDNIPLFEKINCNGSIPVNMTAGEQIWLLSAVDLDELQLITYEILSGNEMDFFDLSTSGKLLLKKSFSGHRVENLPTFSLKVTATDGENYALPMVINLTVTSNDVPLHMQCEETRVVSKLAETIILSSRPHDVFQEDEEDTFSHIHIINYHPPEFDSDLPSSVDIREDAPVNSTVIHFAASDQDTGFSGVLVYVISDGNDDSCFTIDMNSGLVKILSPLDRETTSFYILNITVYDLGTPQKSSWKLLAVNILDANDNAPAFEQEYYSVKVFENVALGTMVKQITARDNDLDDNAKIQYSLLTPTDKFAVNDLTGEINVAGPLDREYWPKYVLTIQARDHAKVDSQLFSTVEVSIILEDVNDNTPSCIPPLQRVKTLEDLPVGTVVLMLDAYDPDSGDVEMIKYIFVSDGNGTFKIDTLSGAIRLEKNLDFESKDFYNLTVIVMDNGSTKSLSSTCHVEIEVIDVNENLHTPRFPSFIFKGSVSENSPLGTSVMKLTAQDGDTGMDGTVRYFISDGTGSDIFSIDEETGVLKTRRLLDREETPSYWLTVYATDLGSVPLHSCAYVYIEVTDINDNVPLAAEPVYYASVMENSPKNVLVIQLNASDADDSSKGKITFHVGPGAHQRFFNIDSQTGVISTTSHKLDREQKDEYAFEVTISDNGVPPLQSVTRVVIQILDENDNSPHFPDKLYKVSLPEYRTTVNPEPVYRLIASDKDIGVNAEITYSIESSSDEAMFKIHPTTGIILSQNESKAGDYHILTVRATDNGRFPRSSTTKLHIEWIPVPEPSTEPLAFDEPHFNVAVMETDSVNHMLGVISTEYSSSHVWFDIINGDDNKEFDIEKNTGRLVIAKPLDAGKKSNYNLTVRVTDGTNIITTQAYIHVININQHRPQFQEKKYEVRIPEDTPPGREILKISATDEDGWKSLIYTIYNSIVSSSMKKFQLDPTSGSLITMETLDHETLPMHMLTVMVRDQDMPVKRNFVRVVIHVEDSNDHPPQFSSVRYEGHVLDLSAVGTEVLQVTALDQDKGSNAEIQYSILTGNTENLFTIDSQSGIIRVAKKLDQSAGRNISLTVKAIDQGFPRLSDVTTVHIYVAMSENTPPKFSSMEYFTEVSEAAAIGSPVITVSATCQTSVTYEIKEGNLQQTFFINSFSGVISTNTSLDFEMISSYVLLIRGTNMAGAFSDVTVFIYVVDSNDNPPLFTKSVFTGYISESDHINSVVVDEWNMPLCIGATDADKDVNALLFYQISEPGIQKYFRIDPNMGTLTTTSSIDYEVTPSFHFAVQVHDQGVPLLFAPIPAEVSIFVKDINDSPPVFSQSFYEATVYLPAHEGTGVLSVKAEDPDSNVTYSVADGNYDNVFIIHPNTGHISVRNISDLARDYSLVVRASDGLHRATAQVKINAVEIKHSSLKFLQNPYLAAFPENSQEVKTIAVLKATGGALNEPLLYSILNFEEKFKVVPSSGILQTKGEPFDREEQDTYEVAVQVRDSRNPPRVAQTQVRITITDVNDNAPEFVNTPYYTTVQDDAEPGDVIFQVSVVDRDTGENGAVTFSLDDDHNYFWIEPFLGDIAIKQSFDYEALNQYILKVIARDGGYPSIQTEVEVLIIVRNKSNPLFQSPYYAVTVSETISVYTPILHVQARSPEGFRVVYNLVGEESFKYFSIDFKTGVLSIINQLDYESQKKHTLTVRATDAVLGAYTEAVVEVDVDDINDNPPSFSKVVYHAEVSEGRPAGTFVIQVNASDADSGRNKLVNYHIVNNDFNSSEFFHINSVNGKITTTQELDYEEVQLFHIKVRAVDNGVPQLSTDTLIIVNVSDINDNPPKFTHHKYEANISELATCGYIVSRVLAFDLDNRDANKLEYRILSGNDNRHFAINSTSGIISVSNLCRHNLASAYKLTASVSDGIFESVAPVYINTVGTNKYSPTFDQDVYEAELAENVKIGTKVIELAAVDLDSGVYGTVEYTIINKLAQEKFHIDNSGRIVTIQKLDRENATERVISIKVMAKDGGGKVDFCTVKIILTDENDNFPQFKASEYKISVRSNASKGSPIIQVMAYDADDGKNADVTYSILANEENSEEFIEINPLTGVVSIKENLIRLKHNILNFSVQAEDGGNPQKDSAVPLQVKVVSTEVPLPKFSEPLYSFSTTENLPAGSEIGTVKAVAEDPVIYSLVEGNTFESNRDGIFTVDQATGTLLVDKDVDHERSKWYQIDILAQCMHRETEIVSVVSVDIQVKDENDNQPCFEADPYKVYLMENMPIGTTVIQITATDQDSGLNSLVTYSLRSKPDDIADIFTIDGETGWISTLQEMDCESKQVYRFYVVASDHGRNVQLSSSALVEVIITDENDNPPQFTSDVYQGSVIENSPPGQLVASLMTTDADVSENGRQVVCHITGGDPLGQFTVESVGEEWRIFVKKTLDREMTANYFLEVTASDGRFQATAVVEIYVLDINDNSPQCDQMVYTGTVSEDASPGLPILTVVARDPDHGINAQITYTLHGTGANEFRLDPVTGELATLASLDRELKAVYDIFVKATDGGGQSCQMDVVLTVTDVNDNAPAFSSSHYAVAIFDNTTVKMPVAVVLARDLDEGLNSDVVYSLVESASEQFSVESSTGIIRLEKTLPEEHQSTFELTVCASDQGSPKQLSAFATVMVSVVDLSDYLPVFLHSEYMATVTENTKIGTEIMNVFARMETGEVTYKILSGNEHEKFSMNPKTGALYVRGSLDYEVCHGYFLSVEGARGGSSTLSDITTVIINVTDINDNIPQFLQDSYSIDVNEDTPVGEVILKVSADDRDGQMHNQITYSTENGDPQQQFFVNPMTGEIEVNKHLDREEISSYIMTIRANDNGDPPQYKDVNVTIQITDVNDNPPLFFQLNHSVACRENIAVGTNLLNLRVTDRDTASNGPPFHFRITAGNDGKNFHITHDGILQTATVLNRKAKDNYQLQVQVIDNGYPPLSSLANVNIRVIEESYYEPSALPLEIFITTSGNAFSGGVIGKIHATDRDPHDTLTYSLVSSHPRGTPFSVNVANGMIIAHNPLQQGHYALNVSVSDGKFKILTTVHVHVWGTATDALGHAVAIRFSDMTPEDFIGYYWHNFQRFLENAINVDRHNIHILSLQKTETPKNLDVVLAAKESYALYSNARTVIEKIVTSRSNIKDSTGIIIDKVIHPVCYDQNCASQTCHKVIQLNQEMMSTYSTARLSVITPQHVLKWDCICNDTAVGFTESSYIQYRLKESTMNDFTVHFHLKTHQLQAVLFFLNGTHSALLQITNGELSFQYNCGGKDSGVFSLKNFTVSNGQWHTVQLQIKEYFVHLLLDHRYNSSTTLSAVCEIPQSKESVFFGGIVHGNNKHRWVNKGFKGCLDSLVLNGKQLRMKALLDEQIIGKTEEVGLQQCCAVTSGCVSDPCMNGGQCKEHLNGGYFCLCLPQFFGDVCEFDNNPCLSNPCQNGGTCVPMREGFTCNCFLPYMGPSCEKSGPLGEDDCLKDPCSNDTNCANTTNSNGKCSVHGPEISGHHDVYEAVAAVAGICLLVGIFVLFRKCICKRKTHKPVKTQDPDLLLKNDISKNVGVGTELLPPIELRNMKGSQNDLDRKSSQVPKMNGHTEFNSFQSGPAQKQRTTVVCSVAPNLPNPPPSNSDNESILKSTWDGEYDVYPEDPVYWPPQQNTSHVQEFQVFDTTEEVRPLSCQISPPRDREPGPFGGFPFPLHNSSKRAPIPPCYSNQNLEDFLVPNGPNFQSSHCQKEYTAISYYPDERLEGGGTGYLVEAGQKKVNVRLSMAHPSYAEHGTSPRVVTRINSQCTYDGSDMVESDYGSCEEVMF
ncbi:protocadherin Fat 2 [Protopterus annectens]|uniref:protocadherin Fat 2 n=1 Tax=Protopterus annectens TaxID=7888 RepID=UPI001CFBC138|nr:protocadherin Fat 2 [Protopterus annectens]